MSSTGAGWWRLEPTLPWFAPAACMRAWPSPRTWNRPTRRRSDRGMKRFIRSPWVQWTLSMLLSGYIDLALFTMRWRYVNTEAVDAAVAGPEGIIGCFWHGRIALAVNCRKVLKHKPRRVPISLSADG